ncbi:unnamed protein product [Fraxinus pennsylvanica]|uniref:WAT1-related protein n=1 Tax=Fraxinus pennsylvanica TaxID=56036 RepID=A0AAD2DZT6_9LAMI|nr:unnamed protein product [Fraxinus pennsylvanica]
MDSRNAMPYLAAIILRFVFAGLFIIAKRALNLGMDHFTFTVYRNAIAAVVFGPPSLIFERFVHHCKACSEPGNGSFHLHCLQECDCCCRLWPSGSNIRKEFKAKDDTPHPLQDLSTWLIWCSGSKLVLCWNETYNGKFCNNALQLSSNYKLYAGFAVEQHFIWVFVVTVPRSNRRLEKVKFRSLHGQAKVIGTFVSIGGVVAMTFIKGPVIELPWTKHKPTSAANYHQNSIKGPLMILGACFFSASFNILQAKTLESYTASLSLTAMISTAIGFEGFIASVVFEKGINFTSWSIHWDIKLLAYVYGGILCSGLAYYISGYILREKGPVFLTSFNPLTMLIVAVMSSFILSELLALGKVVGGIVIVVGVYLVLWGKTKDDHSMVSKVSALNSSSMKASSSDGSQATTADNV